MGMLDRNYSEKRDYIRMQINSPAQVLLAENEDSQPLDGTCHDLSGGGMLLSVKQPLQPGQDLVVTIMSSHGHNPMLKALCQVARSESGPKDSYVLGLEIVEVLNQPEAEAV